MKTVIILGKNDCKNYNNLDKLMLMIAKDHTYSSHVWCSSQRGSQTVAKNKFCYLCHRDGDLT